MARLDAFFKKMVELEASDLHLTAGLTPYFRLHGEMVSVTSAPTWDSKEMKEVLFEITPEINQKEFNETILRLALFHFPGCVRRVRARARAHHHRPCPQ